MSTVQHVSKECFYSFDTNDENISSLLLLKWCSHLSCQMKKKHTISVTLRAVSPSSECDPCMKKSGREIPAIDCEEKLFELDVSEWRVKLESLN